MHGKGRRRRRPPLAAAIAAAATVCGGLAALFYTLGAAHGQAAAADAASRQTELDPLRDELRAQQLALRRERTAADLGIAAVARELARMQVRIVYLDALAARLGTASRIADEDFDFTVDPPRGGPEEASSGTTGGAVLVVGTDDLSRQLEDRWRQLSVLEDMLVWRRLSDDVRPEGLPIVSGYVSSRFGERIDPLTGRLALHKGMDFAGRPGTEIVAVGAGIVIWSGVREGYGRIVEIDHGNERVTRYAHNSVNLVSVGEVVTRGQPIARLGDSGRTTGPNLHFEVLRAGEAVDPAGYID